MTFVSPRRLSHRCIALALTAVLLNFAAFTAAQTAGDEAKAKKQSEEVDKIFASWDKKDSPGCALAVIKDGKIIYERGYGMANLDHDIPITPTSVFHVASISKQFTAMAIWLLAEQGKLSLDDEVRKYIKEMPDFGYPITIRHLLHHTSGLRDQWSLLAMAGWRISNDVIKDEDILDLISRQKALNFKPGDEYLYSNTGYTLMAMIVKKVSGQSLREFADANIFKPLGMTSTFFRDDHAVVVKNQAYGYEPAANQSFRLSVPNFDTVGASSLLTTVEDMAKWDQNFYDKRIGGAVIEKMQATATLNSGQKINYASGLVVDRYRGLRIVEHAGADAGYRAHFMQFPDQRFSVVVLANVSFIFPNTLARKVADIYLAGQFKPEEKTETPAVAGVTLTEQQLQKRVGVFFNAQNGDVARTTLRDGKLWLSVSGVMPPLVPLSESRFRIVTPPAEILFESAASGKTVLVIEIGGRRAGMYDEVLSVMPTPAQLSEYAGAYYSEEIDSTYTIALDNERLTLRRKKYPAAVLQPIFKDAFTVSPGLGTLRIDRDEQGRIAGFTLFAGRIRNFRFVKK